MQTLLPRPLLIALIGILYSLLQFSCGGDDENIIPEKEMPQAVIDAFVKGYPNGIVRTYTEETEKETTLYEISFDFDGRTIDATYDVQGSLVELEKSLSVEEVPETIRNAISLESARFAIDKAEVKEMKGKRYYEVLIVDLEHDRKSELLFSDSGALIEKEETTDE